MIDTGKNQSFDYELGVVAGFSELVNAGVKQLALSSPMSSDQMDAFIVEAEKVAAKYNVSVYRESDLMVTDLFPANIAKDQDVLLLYQGTTKDAYLSLKNDRNNLKATDQYKGESRLQIARRFGRMLSYSPKKINQLLAKNTSYRTMQDFGIRASNVFLYYKDLQAASQFYSEILGLERLASYDNADIFRIAADSYLILVDAAKGMHSADEPKTVALALLTDQLDEWWVYLKRQNVPVKYDYKPKTGNAHDGFVMIDPEGYLLEFERFKQHKENDLFIPLLDQNSTVIQRSKPDNKVPENLGFHSSITWLYYKDILGMQNFVEDVMGLEMVADQGWTKIYKVSDTGFLGLVDERRGMHKFTEDKAVTVSFILEDLDGWFDYVQKHQPFELRSDQINAGPEDKYRAFVGYDPEGYYLEFDKFYEHQDNEKLLQYLNN
ncbi:MAG: VOC family protein [Bacteroidia bacterium]|nr:VOC family protein [Bacteroidia bacterium]